MQDLDFSDDSEEDECPEAKVWSFSKDAQQLIINCHNHFSAENR